MKGKNKLRELVIERLVNKGEVCRPNQIAEKLIIKEIADQLSKCPKKNWNSNHLSLMKLVHGVYSRIEKLAKSKKSILHIAIFSNERT